MNALSRRDVIKLGSIAAGGAIAVSGGTAPTSMLSSVTAQGVPGERIRPLDFSPFMADLDALDEARLAEIGELVIGSTVSDLQAAQESGDLSSEDLTLFFLSRVRMYDDLLRSYIELNPAALEEARAADAARASGQVSSRLHGIPVSVKDNIETAGPMRTTAGAVVLADNVAEADAPLVAQLRQAGAVILGKASLSEFAGAVNDPGANAMAGQGINPYGASFPVAGSSSGSAISTSAYLAALSVGTETSGSLIAPSALNGVVGMKPSTGVISSEGVVPLLPSNDSSGPIARSVTDLAALLDVIAIKQADYHAALDPKALRGVTVAVLRDDILAQESNLEDTSDNDVVVQRIDEGMADAGATVVDSTLETDDQFENAFGVFLLSGVALEIPAYLSGVGLPIETLTDVIAFNEADPSIRIPNGQAIFDQAATAALSPDQYEAIAPVIRSEATEPLEAAFSASGAAMLVSLTNVHSTSYASAGYPAITIPLGLRSIGMPTGVTFIGRPGEDAALIGYAFAFEQATLLREESDLESLSNATPTAGTPAAATPAAATPVAGTPVAGTPAP